MSKKGRDWVFRFAVGAPGGPQSSVWRVWNNRSDVYIAHRSMGHINKISIHPLPEANCNYGITGEYAKRHTGSRRDLLRWRRAAVPPAGRGGMAPVLWAVFPTDYLGNDTADLGVRWIPAAPKGTATQISMFFTLETLSIVEASLSNTDGRVEEYVSLPNGEAFAIVSSTMSDWENRDLWLRGGPDFANVGFRAEDEKGADRSEILCLGPEPKDGEPLRLEELRGNHLKGGEKFGPNAMTLTGGPFGVSSALQQVTPQ